MCGTMGSGDKPRNDTEWTWLRFEYLDSFRALTVSEPSGAFPREFFYGLACLQNHRASFPSMASHILSKITVVDMTEGVAGPYAATLLGDMGANVIKIERPDGDWSRTSGKGDLASVGTATFISLNRNKRNLGLDLAAPGGREIIERLISRADVVLSNYRAGVMAKLGLDYARCRELSPGIIYCTVSGFGQEGPYAGYPASDTIMQAMTGVMSVVGEADGPPLRVGFPLIDMTAANHAVQAVLLALYDRANGQPGGQPGAEIDISLMAAGVALMNPLLTDYMASGRVAQRQGNQNTSLAPAGAFEVACRRYITIAVLRDEHWRKFCAAMDLGHLVDDERFRSNAVRLKNRAALDAIIVPLLKTQSSEVWLERLRKADILCGPINTLADVVADPAIAGYLPLIDPGLPGVARVMGTPIRFNGEYFTADKPPPAKGQHTREVLGELQFSAAEIEAFVQSGGAFDAASG